MLIGVFRRLVLREARAIVVAWQVGGVLYRYLIFLLQLGVIYSNSVYYPPILIFHLCLLGGSFLLEPKFISLLEVLSVLGKGFDAIGLYLLIERLK